MNKNTFCILTELSVRTHFLTLLVKLCVFVTVGLLNNQLTAPVMSCRCPVKHTNHFSRR